MQEEPGAAADPPRRGRRERLDLDLRLLARLRGHQCALPELTGASDDTKLWGGNYEASPDAVFWEFNRSFPFDRRLVREELAASRAWVRALGRCGAIPPERAETLERGLAEVLARLEADPKYLEADVEDVHSFVEERLGELVGELAGQAHLGRSRNEQTVTALRLFARGAIDALARGIAALVKALVEKGHEAAPTR